MKRQLNFWSKPNNASEKDLVNTSLSIEDNQFTIRFGKPGSVKPITQIVFFIDEDKSFDLRRAFELSGCKVFQDEMDERIYFANIAMQREHAKSVERFTVCVGWSVIFYIVCMAIGMFLIKLSMILSLLLSIPLAILVGILIRNKFYNETEASDGP
jgi:hypothetical protein